MNGAVGERQPLDGQALATIHFAQLDATMRLIPLPELAVVLVIALVVLGLRTLREFSLLSFARRVGNVSQPRDGHLETERKRTQLIASCVLLMIISIPLILRVVPPNGVYGFRTASTQSNSAIWYPANTFMGWALLVAAAISAVVLLILPATVKRWLLWAAFLVPMFGAIVASFVYLNGLIESGPL